MEEGRDASVLEAMEPLSAFRRDDGRTGLAVAGGMVAAVAGGLIWAAIVLITHYEIGWIAWGVGLLVGAAMGWITSNRGRGLGVAAAALAVAGLLIGKLVITVGSAGAISEEVLGDPDALHAAVARQMYEAEEFDPVTQQRAAAAVLAGDTLSNALWAEMLRQAEEKAAGMTEEELRLAARATARDYIGWLGFVEAVRVQLGPWDLLWFGLALVTAYRMMVEGKVEEASTDV